VSSELALVQVNVCGSVIEAGKDENGEVWVPINGPCQRLDLATNGQIEKLKNARWATHKMILFVAADGKIREFFCIDLDSLPMWLATIHESKVKPDARPVLIAFQKEAKRVLAEHFFGRKSDAAMSVPDLREIVRQELAAVIATMAPRKTKPRLPEQEDFLQAPKHAPLLGPLETLAWELDPHEGAITVRQILAEMTPDRRAGCPVRIAIAQHLDRFVAHDGVQSVEVRVGRYLGTLTRLPPHDSRVVFKMSGLAARWGVRRVSRGIVAA
jgi:hypothetical protein